MLCLLNTSKITHLQDNIYYTYDHKQIIVLVQFSIQNMLKNKMLICCECICLSANCSHSIRRWITKLGAQVHLRPLKLLSVSHMISSCYLANPLPTNGIFLAVQQLIKASYCLNLTTLKSNIIYIKYYDVITLPSIARRPKWHLAEQDMGMDYMYYKCLNVDIDEFNVD